MVKFKVGDKVVFDELNKGVAKEFGYHPNKSYEVINVFPNEETIQIINENGSKNAFAEYRFNLIDNKRTKNQRITALENEVAELRPLKDTVSAMQERLERLGVIVEKVRKPSTVVQESLTAATSVEDKPQSEGERLVKQCEQHFSSVEKSPNKKRAEIIEKAKAFVEENKKINGCYKVKFGYVNRDCVNTFVVNEEKRTIVSLLKGFGDKHIYARGIAKCMPSDVFNEHIGKAIALGRALGLDVSEFENAVQPTEIVIGQIVKSDLNGIGGVALKSDKENYSFDYAKRKNLTIINDTNAQYGGVE